MTNDTAQLLAALTRQEELLKRLITALDKPKLGLHNDAGSCKIYCNRQHGHLWYSLDGDRNPKPITATALTGYLKELKFEQTERRGKPCHKLLATIAADRVYILESGHDTHFSKGLLVAVALMTPQQLLSPVTIMPAPGDDDSVLFCRVWCGSEYIKVSYDESVNWREIAKAALANVKTANEMPF
ncbi:hypothetical protein WA1_51580 [Scytonema hofmannii PCC 7110]|uniref:Uncharacterized protein n=1 Tax=Scytonema hofmannii PCC 7110 TaxID=128403 RepID=A0A139WPY7_9CYAN|nr:hypothetical protein [Scytonema hofmannii]KYC34487.1 hypothetical protein WA1_51580 [Scytonema hofmannii PCC 7110]